MDPTRWRYLPALDGVRALAVAAVLAFHWWPDTFGGGFIGVDVFFVLSGYLITAMLLVEQRSRPPIDLRGFWMRRVRRLLPAVWLLVAVTTVVVVVDGSASARWLVEVSGALTWTSNWLGLHFDGATWWRLDDRGALAHLWSLAIEEQFYLVWPLVMTAMFRWLPRRRDRLIVVGLLIAASAWAMGATDQITAYFATHTRSFGLLAGAGLAISGLRLPQRSAAWVAGGSVAALAVFAATGDPNDGWMYPWGFLGVAAVSTALTASQLDPAEGERGRSWLEWSPLRAVGRVSYGIYLWHVPVAVFVTEERLGVGPVATAVARVAVLTVVVVVSYVAVEQPVRRRDVRLLSSRVLAIGVVIAVSAVPLVAAARDDVENPWVVAEDPPAVVDDERSTMVVGDLAAAAVLADLPATIDDASGVVLWGVGDVGGVLSDVDAGVSGDDRDVGRDDYCVHWPERWSDAIDRFDPDAVMIVAGYGDTVELLDGGSPVVDDRLDELYAETVERMVATVPEEVGEVVLVTIDPISQLAGDEREPGARDRAAGAWATAARLVAGRHERMIVCSVSPVDRWPQVAAAVRPLVVDASRCPT